MPELKLVEKKEDAKVPYPNQFVMLKNYEGGLVVKLDPHDFSTPARRIDFAFNQERQYIPAKYAIGVFVSDGALRQMERNYFTFENLDVLIEMAESMGFYVPDSIKSPKVTLKEIRTMLSKGEVNKIKDILGRADRKTKDDFLASAIKLYGTLNMGVINTVEKELGVSLTPVKIDE